MSSKLFEKLLQSSKALVDSPTQSETPQLERELSQIASESLLLKNRLNTDQGLNATAHYFLAQSGANTQEVCETLNTIDTRVTFQPLEKLPTNDVESYLKQVQKEIVIATVQETNRNTRENVLELLEDSLQRNWRDSRRKILEDWDYEQEDKKFGRKVQGKDQQVQSFKKQMISFSTVIKELNKSRLLSENTPIIKKFKSLAQLTSCDKMQERSMLDSWDIASSLTNESRENGPQFNVSLYGGAETTVKKNRRLIESSRGWLENEFMSYVKDTLNKKAVEAKVGGSPSLKHRMQAFMTSVFSKNSIWIDEKLEIQKNMPIWLYTYLLIRSGHHDLALNFVNENTVFFNDSPSFPTYLKEYFSSPVKLVSDQHRKEILEQYQRMVYGNIPSDPYKILLYKIIGRCELESKNIPVVIKTTEDYLWLELMLIRESVNLERYSFEIYRLIHFQNKISNAGPAHFDPNGTNPWFYFKILLLSLQFEKAIDYLYKSEKFRLEAVHFGIALAYYGLPCIPKEPLEHTLELLVTEVDGSVSLNFSRLISQFVRLFVTDASDDTLQYLYLITLYPTEDMTILCREYIINYIVRCDKYKQIIGYIDNKQGTVQPGSIEQYKPLIGIDRHNGDIYKKAILYPIAQKFQHAGKYKDAVSAYELSGKYTDALKVLNTEIDYALDRPSDPKGQGLLQQHRVDESLIEFCNTVLRNYENNVHIDCDQKVLDTHKTLLKFLQACIQYEQGQYEQTVEIIKSTYILPDNTDFTNVQSAAMRFDNHTEYTIRKHISDILVMTMESYHKLWQKYSVYNANIHTGYQENIAKIKGEASAILQFVSLIKFEIPADIVVKLNKNELLAKNVLF
ncbi:Nup93/Nic96-domain-containing protein [Helicostylum pulchrum]|nr:Nup93/Nic96-domain-containing protein [Helicostylum pulchrum]